jgi:hypothetical protein
MDLKFLKLLILKVVLDRDEQKAHEHSRNGYAESIKILNLEEKFLLNQNVNEFSISPIEQKFEQIKKRESKKAAKFN